MTWRRLLVLAGIAGAALCLRAHRLDAESLWLDEFSQVYLYSLPVSYVVTESAHLAQPPLDVLIGGGLYRLGLADSDWWVRLPACLFGAAGVLLLGWMVTRVVGFGAGIAAAVLLAVCPLHVAMSQEARPYSLLVFLCLASVLTFSWAWRRPGVLRWSVFGLAHLGLLLTRWVAPHFVTSGLCVYMAWSWFAAWRRRDAEGRRQIALRMWGGVTAGLAAYAVYGPVFGIIFDRSRRAIHRDGTGWFAESVALLQEAFSATFHGYSWRTLYTALPGNKPVLLVAAGLAAVGALCLLRRWRAERTVDGGLFVYVFLPFPFLYALLFAWLANAPAKPQYLIVLVVPLLACIAAAADALCRRWLPGSRTLRLAGWCLVVLPVAGWMLRSSTEALASQDKRDWRGVMGHLHAHAGPEDTFAAVSPDKVPTCFHTPVGGLGRYFAPSSKFLRIELDSDPAELQKPHWDRTDQTVWVLCITDPMYRGRELLPAPGTPPAPVRVHRYHGLFLLEVSGSDPAWSRLVSGIEYLYRDLPDQRSLVAPGVFVGRFLARRGLTSAAARFFARARRQCADDDQCMILAEKYLPPAGRLARTSTSTDGKTTNPN